MRFVIRGIPGLVLGGLCSINCAQAQPAPSQLEIKGLVERFVAAYNAKDASRLEPLYSAGSQACFAAEKKNFRDVYDFILTMMWRDPIPANYTFRVSAINENNLKAMETFGNFPTKPARELHIEYQQGEDQGSVELYLVQENGHWLLDQLCESEARLKQIRDEAPARKKREAHYKSIADGIPEPLRSELIALLDGHKTGEATARYMKATGQDGQAAILVIDQLAHETRH